MDAASSADPAVQAPSRWRRFRDRIRTFGRDGLVRSSLTARDRLAGWYLRHSSSRLVREVLIPIGIAAVIRGGLVTTSLEPRTNAGEGFLDAMLVILSSFAVQVFEGWALGGLQDTVREIGALAIGPNRRLALHFADGQLTELHTFLSQLVSEEGVERSRGELEMYFDLFFEYGGPHYVGVDRHVPSTYLRDYEWYLRLEERALDSLPERARSRAAHKRVLVATENELHDDWARNLVEWISFCDRHDRNGIQPFRVEPADAERLRLVYHLRTTDVALWPGRFAVLFQDTDGDNVRVAVIFPDDPRYEACTGYVNAITKPEIARPLDRTELQRKPVGTELAAAWEKYVNPAVRDDPHGRLARFLGRFIDPNDDPLVLDAAAGLGCDSVLLMNQGLSVVSNEIDPDLRATASQYAQQHARGRALHLEACSWEVLSGAIPGGLRFDVVLVLGNSICLVGDEEMRRSCIDEFYTVLRPGGALLIDERNFSEMLEARMKIPDELPDAFDCSWEVMYCGEEVRGCPWCVDEEQVLWRIYRNVPPVKNSQEISAARIGKDLELHPFGTGELARMLISRFGRENVTAYADFEDCELGDLLAGKAPRADFLTYCARRPSYSVIPLHPPA
jgi:SAM-dependent methyltransferase